MDITPSAKVVLEKRYLRNGETPEQMLKRVAINIAEVEKLYGGDNSVVGEWTLKFYTMMDELLFLPNSPTLMNAGRPRQQLSACFPAGTMIETISGPCPIELIKIGDSVLTHRGRYKEVTQVMTRQGNLWEVKIDKLPAFTVTAEHPFLTERGFVQVKDLQPKQDFVAIGRALGQQFSETFSMGLDAGDGLTYQRNRSPRKTVGLLSRQVNPIKAEVIYTEEVAWLCGYYIANGSLSQGNDLRFAMDVRREDLATRIQDILFRCFNVESQQFSSLDKKRNHRKKK